MIFFFDEDVGGWGEHGGALVSGKPNQRREKTKEREKMEGGVNVGLRVLSEVKLVMCMAHD